MPRAALHKCRYKHTMYADDKVQLQNVPRNLFHRLHVQMIFRSARLIIIFKAVDK